MAGERHAIDDPFVIDASARAVPPLKFVLQASHVPTGILEELGPGVVAAHTPWFTEVALEVTGVPGVAAAVLYVIPKDDDTSLLAACVDQTFTPLYRVMSGQDFGDAITTLVARHWPQTHALLVNSQQHVPEQRFLACVRTPTKVQWVVANELRGAQRESIDPTRARSLVIDTLQTVIRAEGFVTELPGALQALGGPDRRSRRLTALSTVFTAAGSIGSGVSDGIEVDELIGLAEDVRDVFEALQRLKD